jgi:hypothetical protein
VSRQDAEIPVLAGNLHFLRHIADNHLLRSDDLELESVGHVVVVVRRWSLAHLTPPAIGRRRRTNVQRLLLCYGLQFFCRFQNFIDLALHVEGLFWNVVVLAFIDFLEAFHRIGDFHVAAGCAGKLFGHVERLR